MAKAKLKTEINFDAVFEQVAQGYISAQKHPAADLRILNYTQRAQYDWHWTPETMACRGLIVDGQNNIVARPFPKFFNFDGHSRSDLIWSKPFTVTAKLDGSLGILYQAPDGAAIATRGSFISEQAKKATAILREKYPDLRVPENLTALFEIIYPENRIVCNYGDVSDLFLLTVTDTRTGMDAADTPALAAELIGWTGSVVEQYPVSCKPTEVLDALGLPQDGSVEGVVLRFAYPKGSYTRMKVKTDEYKRLHRILTGINARHIWEELSAGRSLDPILERVPDEYFAWVKQIEGGLRESYGAIESQCRADFRQLEDRKSTALYFQTRPYPSVLFNMLDGKDYSQHIWKFIKPQASVPFRCGDDIS